MALSQGHHICAGLTSGVSTDQVTVDLRRDGVGDPAFQLTTAITYLCPRYATPSS